ncbi:helix-turn-helix domain-containing protein (plasmid) [Ureibacillus chungkukjangi]|uniref:helix-turn-helix domain-containing protein n=1 Tax=Ureibacillus chungkukjangi TaxID=1202712 RepID=UPI000D36D218|nr:helix-turn-helix domain-containing protein [Ureibacillus chungkukjangi]MCM3390443.1 helix-turn-helix domain-containing protein [Ureibacillus chungkukjangi]
MSSDKSTTSHKKKYYTASEAAEILGVTRQTIYKYGQQGDLEQIDEPYKIGSRYMFTCESVEELLNREKSLKENGIISLPEISKELNIPKHRLYNIIKTHDLSYEIDKEHFSKPTAIITEEVKGQLLEQIASSTSHKQAKLNFSNRSNNIAIYQKFYDENMEEKRLLLKEDNGKYEWGFKVADGFLSYKKAQQLGYKPSYTISKSTAKQAGYAKFSFPKYEPTTFDFLDFLYRYLGISNLYIEKNETNLLIDVREGTIQIKDEEYSFTHDWLVAHLVEGKVKLTENVLTVFSNRKYITLYLETEQYQELYAIASEENSSFNEQVETAIKNYIEAKKCK